MLNKPFKLRKKWEGFDEKEDYIYIKKLANLFSRHHNIDIDEFFIAPYKVYQDETSHPLKFYTTMRAIKCYEIHMTKKLNITTKELRQKLKQKTS